MSSGDKMESDKPLVNMQNVADAAQFLGISAVSVRRLERDGELLSVRYAGRVLFRPQDLREFVDRHTTEA